MRYTIGWISIELKEPENDENGSISTGCNTVLVGD